VNPTRSAGRAKQHRIDTGQQSGTTTSHAARIKALEQENRELKRANEILLLAASSFLVRELDPRLPWLWRSLMTTATGSGSSRSAACSLSTAWHRPEKLLRAPDPAAAARRPVQRATTRR